MIAPWPKLLFSKLKFSFTENDERSFRSPSLHYTNLFLKNILNACYALGAVLFISAFPVSKAELLPWRRWQHFCGFQIYEVQWRRSTRAGRVWERKLHESAEDFSGLCGIWMRRGDREGILDNETVYGGTGMYVAGNAGGGDIDSRGR